MKYIFCALVLLSFATSSAAGYYSNDAPGINNIGTLFPTEGSFSVEVRKRLVDGAWWGDTYSLVIQQGGGIKAIEWPFQSDYGKFKVFVAKLRDGIRPEIVLISARGKGTSSTSYYLDIYEIEDGTLVKSYERIISEYYGPEKIWWYDVGFDHAGSDHDHITLTLETIAPADVASKLDDPKLIPNEKNISIWWDDKSRHYVEK